MALRAGIAALLAAGCLIGAGAAQADGGNTVRVAYTPTGGYVSGFVAAEKGFFAAHGLAVELQLIALNSNIPAAMVAGSIEIGGTTTIGLLQAVDGGIPLVAVSGGAYASKDSTTGAVLVRTGSGIAKPADLVGRKIGVPGLGAILHVLTMNWILANGVDPRKVTYVEMSFVQEPDALKSGLVDAVTTAEPTYSQILRSGSAIQIGRIYDALPRETQGIVYSATAEWAGAHRDLVHGFQAANAEAAAYVPAHPDEARAALVKYLHVTPAVASAVELPRTVPEVTADQLQVMIDVMNRLGLLGTKIDPTKLLAP